MGAVKAATDAVPKGTECKGELIAGPKLRSTSNLALGVVDNIIPRVGCCAGAGGLVPVRDGKNEMTGRRHEQAGTLSTCTYGRVRT